ncbi:hypothetical protein BJ742DRAFT_389107 [Cladochytrium replicatum]|nr:hypothetical protein BJ742DRAFT_389107 [Cladochytrium replicatum]
MVQMRSSVDRNARTDVQPAQAPIVQVPVHTPSLKVGEFGAVPAKQERDMRAFSVMVPPPSSILGKNVAPAGRSPVSPKSSPFADPLFRSMIIMMLYPITFIILWSGALVNRLVEASGNENFTIGDFMQSPMQLIPGALSLVYLCAQANRLGYLGPRFSVSGNTPSATNHHGVAVPLPEPISVGISSSQKIDAQTPSELKLGPRVPHLQTQYYQQRLQSPIGQPGAGGDGYAHFGAPVSGYAPLGPFAQRSGPIDAMHPLS